MIVNIEIAQDVFDRLSSESIGAVDLSEDKLVDKLSVGMLPTTTVLTHTHNALCA
jgi:hypothetical protein